MRSLLVFVLLTGTANAQTYINGVQQPPPLSAAQAAAAAPVQSVNAATGAVNIPTYQRQDGSVTWTFPQVFGNQPTCWPSLAASSTTYTFDYPQQSAISQTSVSYVVSAHPKTMSVGSLTLPILLQLTPAGAPSGTTLTLSCIAPL